MMIEEINVKQNCTYEFKCPYCDKEYKTYGMPSIEVMKIIGHTMKCPNCGSQISIINDYSSII